MAKTLEIWAQGGRDPHPANKFKKIEEYSAMNSLGNLVPGQMVYNRSGIYDAYTQSAAITFTIPGEVIDGVGQVVKFTADGVNNISFDSNFDTTALYNITAGSPLAAGTYWFYMLGVGGKVHLNVKSSS